MNSQQMVDWLKKAKTVIITAENHTGTYRATLLAINEAQGFITVTTTNSVERLTDEGWVPAVKKISTFSCYAGEISHDGNTFTFQVEAYTFNGQNEPFETKVSLIAQE